MNQGRSLVSHTGSHRPLTGSAAFNTRASAGTLDERVKKAWEPLAVNQKTMVPFATSLKLGNLK